MVLFVIMTIALLRFENAVADAECLEATGVCKGTRVVSKPPMMMQMNVHSAAQQRAQTRSTSGDRRVAASIASRLRDPAAIGSSLQCGLLSIFDAVVHFSAEPPRIQEGVSKLGEDLFNCVKGLLDSGVLQELGLGDLGGIQQLWQGNFDDLQGSAESIFADLERFVRDGDPPVLIRAIGSIIGEASTLVSSLLPAESAAQIVTYLGAIEDAFESIGQSWDEFAKGNAVGGIQAAYAGLRNTANSMLSDALKNDETIQAVIGTLDNVFGNLSKTVLEFERRIMESNVCWRVETNRERERPQICPNGYHWDGAAFCYPLAGLIQSKVAAQSLDSSLMSKGGGDSVPARAIPARCNSEGDFPEKHGQFCYSQCDGGLRAKSHSRCISSCEGRFPTESPLMCARDQGVLTKTILEMATVVTNAALTVADTLTKLGERGIDAQGLTSTIQVFIDAAKPFANPTCPISDEPAPPSRSPATRFGCRFDALLYLTGHRGQQLASSEGKLTLSSAKDESTQWTFTDAGDGLVFITGSDDQSLIDRNGQVGLSPNKQDWEKWSVRKAGDGKVYFSSHGGRQLQDHYGQARLSWNSLAWEQWTVTDGSGSAACDDLEATTTSTTTSSAAPSTPAPTPGAEDPDSEGDDATNA
eukprot:TRINITY_DN3591_c0_g1_i1.p1 TRINITY_DN3591_c0_g1~~TRINITY_DN3591_c0_g1_i1.p1  ORF type:complete len:680 (-),score=120.49 TRINITY_DN3591_c0_g1_i1:453-2378(-)